MCTNSYSYGVVVIIIMIRYDSVPDRDFTGKKYRTQKLEAIKYWNTPLSM